MACFATPMNARQAAVTGLALTGFIGFLTELVKVLGDFVQASLLEQLLHLLEMNVDLLDSLRQLIKILDGILGIKA
jgi:hypothetical protein